MNTLFSHSSKESGSSDLFTHIAEFSNVQNNNRIESYAIESLVMRIKISLDPGSFVEQLKHELIG